MSLFQTWPDGWTAATEDGKRSAQFEHTLLVTADGCEVRPSLHFVLSLNRIHSNLLSDDSVACCHSILSYQISCSAEMCLSFRRVLLRQRVLFSVRLWQILTARLDSSPPLWWEK
jgi:hypothetical protein